MRDDLNGPRIRQVFVHRHFHLLDPLVKVLMVLFELFELLQGQLEELRDAQAGELRATKLAEDLSQHRLIFTALPHHRPISGHLAQKRVLSA